MTKVILIFGLIAGGVLAGFLLIMTRLCLEGNMDFDNSEITGYGIMVIALSMIFFGIKSYRDNRQNGEIKFVKGLQVGLLITLTASLLYAISWEIYYQAIPDIKDKFMDKYVEYVIEKMKKDGESGTQIEQTTKEMAAMKEMYKNPFIRFGMTLAEILPVGIIITLISAGILRRKEVLPA